MNALVKLAGAVLLAGGIDRAPALAQTVITAPGGSTTGTYMDYMKTVYARASALAELLQMPLTSFDNDSADRARRRELDAVRRRAHLDLQAARRPGLERRRAAEGRGLCLRAAARRDHRLRLRLVLGFCRRHQELEGSDRRQGRRLDPRHQGRRRQDHRGHHRRAEAVSAERRQPLVPGAQAPVRQVRRRLGDQRRHHHLFRPVQGEELGEVEQLRGPGQERRPTPVPGRRRSIELDVDPTLGAPEVGMPAFLAGDARLHLPQCRPDPGGAAAVPGRDPHERGVRDVLHLVRPRRARRSTTPTCAAPSTTPSTATS